MSSFVEKMVGQDLMVYDAEKDAVHILNPTAQRVLTLRRSGLEAEAIGAALRLEFQLPPNHPVLEEVQESLRFLTERGLVS